MSDVTGYRDVPIGNLSDDLFNVDSYVKGLCHFILNCDTPMTISIQGDWGSGKTSMMNMIKTELGEKILPIWFNTWQFSQFQLDNSLAISMMRVLLKNLGSNADNLEKLSNMAGDLKKNIVVIATEMLTGSSTLGQIIGNGESSNCVDEITALKEKFQKAVDDKLNTKTNCNRIVVFIDDLDRLQPLKAIELLEVLKLFLDCEKCVFLLAIDYEVVTLGIRQKYGSDIDAAKGKSFFDKIIQLPFKMPVNQYDIDKYSESMMKKMKIIDDKEKNVKLFSSLIKNSVGLNPRSMKRLFNAYQLLYNIMQPEEIKYNDTQEVKNDILKQRILFATVCMQMSFEALYDYLSVGNVDIDTLKRLADIDDKNVTAFMKQHFVSELPKVAESEDNILDLIFDTKTSMEDLSVILQKLPNFIKDFMEAIRTSKDNELSEKEVGYLRDILKRSAITSIKTVDQGEASQQAIDRRQKNRDIAQKVNELLKNKVVGKFEIAQSKSSNNGIISSAIAGYIIYKGKDNKEYHLRYVLNYVDKVGISVNIYINGHNQDSQKFYKSMGNNPLNYSNLPIMNEQPGWYFYDDVLTVSDDEEGVAKIAETVADAYNRLNDYIAKKSKSSN